VFHEISRVTWHSREVDGWGKATRAEVVRGFVTGFECSLEPLHKVLPWLYYSSFRLRSALLGNPGGDHWNPNGCLPAPPTKLKGTMPNVGRVFTGFGTPPVGTIVRFEPQTKVTASGGPSVGPCHPSDQTCTNFSNV
jgi:hypothetical protein